MKQIKHIEIIRREGWVRQTNISHYAESWKKANRILMDMATTAPEKGGYDKTDFYIEFEDGFKYQGRYDLKHSSIEFPCLFNHIKDHVLFYAGLRKPLWMTNEQYVMATQDVDSSDFKEFARSYLGLEV